MVIIINLVSSFYSHEMVFMSGSISALSTVQNGKTTQNIKTEQNEKTPATQARLECICVKHAFKGSDVSFYNNYLAVVQDGKVVSFEGTIMARGPPDKMGEKNASATRIQLSPSDTVDYVPFDKSMKSAVFEQYQKMLANCDKFKPVPDRLPDSEIA